MRRARNPGQSTCVQQGTAFGLHFCSVRVPTSVQCSVVVSRWERGEVSLSYVQAHAVEQALGLRPRSLGAPLGSCADRRSGVESVEGQVRLARLSEPINRSGLNRPVDLGCLGRSSEPGSCLGARREAGRSVEDRRVLLRGARRKPSKEAPRKRRLPTGAKGAESRLAWWTTSAGIHADEVAQRIVRGSGLWWSTGRLASRGDQVRPTAPSGRSRTRTFRNARNIGGGSAFGWLGQRALSCWPW